MPGPARKMVDAGGYALPKGRLLEFDLPAPRWLWGRVVTRMHVIAGLREGLDIAARYDSRLAILRVLLPCVDLRLELPVVYDVWLYRLLDSARRLGCGVLCLRTEMGRGRVPPGYENLWQNLVGDMRGEA